MELRLHLGKMAIIATVGMALAACGGGGNGNPSFAPLPPAASAQPGTPASVAPVEPASQPAAPAAVAVEPALVPAQPESVGFSSQGLQNVVQALRDLVNAKGAVPPDATVFVARHGKIVLDDIYNGPDLHGGKPLKADTIYRMHSMTKPVTAVAMLQLYEKGLWKLDDPIDKFIPEFKNLQVYQPLDSSVAGKPVTKPASRSATMLELMTHMAGFAYGLAKSTPFSPVDDMYFAQGVLRQESRQAFIDKIASLPLASEPGTQWQYSIAADIQGVIIERLTGKTLAQYMSENIFVPLKMVDTGFNIPENKRSRLASLYAAKSDGTGVELSNGPPPFDGLEAVVFTDPPAMPSGGGGLLSTTADYARFAQMLLKGGEIEGQQILKPETVKLMMTNHITPAQAWILNLGMPGVGFGLNGYVVIDPGKMKIKQGLGTYSWGGAAGTAFWVDPTNDLIALGMMQVLVGAGTLDPVISPKIYDALTDPSR